MSSAIGGTTAGIFSSRTVTDTSFDFKHEMKVTDRQNRVILHCKQQIGMWTYIDGEDAVRQAKVCIARQIIKFQTMAISSKDRQDRTFHGSHKWPRKASGIWAQRHVEEDLWRKQQSQSLRQCRYCTFPKSTLIAHHRSQQPQSLAQQPPRPRQASFSASH